ncbi:hypothetical protein [Thermaurantiacus sp.]
MRDSRWIFAGAQATWLVKRWNAPASQANICLTAGAGAGLADGPPARPAALTEVQADWETRRLILMGMAHLVQAPAIGSCHMQMARAQSSCATPLGRRPLLALRPGPLQQRIAGSLATGPRRLRLLPDDDAGSRGHWARRRHCECFLALLNEEGSLRILLALSLLAAATPLAAAMAELVTVTASGLVGDFCARSVEAVMKPRKDVERVSADLDKGEVPVALRTDATRTDPEPTKLVAASGHAVTAIRRAPRP